MRLSEQAWADEQRAWDAEIAQQVDQQAVVAAVVEGNGADADGRARRTKAVREVGHRDERVASSEQAVDLSPESARRHDEAAGVMPSSDAVHGVVREHEWRESLHGDDQVPCRFRSTRS